MVRRPDQIVYNNHPREAAASASLVTFGRIASVALVLPINNGANAVISQ